MNNKKINFIATLFIILSILFFIGGPILLLHKIGNLSKAEYLNIMDILVQKNDLKISTVISTDNPACISNHELNISEEYSYLTIRGFTRNTEERIIIEAFYLKDEKEDIVTVYYYLESEEAAFSYCDDRFLAYQSINGKINWEGERWIGLYSFFKSNVSSYGKFPLFLERALKENYRN